MLEVKVGYCGHRLLWDTEADKALACLQPPCPPAGTLTACMGCKHMVVASPAQLTDVCREHPMVAFDYITGTWMPVMVPDHSAMPELGKYVAGLTPCIEVNTRGECKKFKVEDDDHS